MSNTIIALKKSATPAAVPSGIIEGELGINYADGLLFYKAANANIYALNKQASYGIVAANGTSLVSSAVGDTLTVSAGQHIYITADAPSDTFTITANLAGPYTAANSAATIGSAAFDRANIANNLAAVSFAQANTARDRGNVAFTLATDSGTQANVARVHANSAFANANSAGVTAVAAFAEANSHEILLTTTMINVQNTGQFTGVNILSNYFGRNGTSYIQAYNTDNTSSFIDSSIFFDHAQDNSSAIVFQTQPAGAASDRRQTKISINSANITFFVPAIMSNTWANGQQIIRTGNLGGNVGNIYRNFIISSLTTNVDNLEFKLERTSNGTDWTTASHVIQRRVDATDMGYIKFGHISDDLLTFGENTIQYMKLDGGGVLSVNNSIIIGSINVLSTMASSFGNANTTHTYAIAAYGQANTGRDHANAAFLAANGKLSLTGGTIAGGQLITSGSTTVSPGFIIRDANVNWGISFVGRAAAGAFNPNVILDDSIIYYGANSTTNLAKGLIIGPHSTYTFSYRQNAQSNTHTFVGNGGVFVGTMNLEPTIIAAFASGNTGQTIGSAAFGQANTGRTHANSAFVRANTGISNVNVVILNGGASGSWTKPTGLVYLTVEGVAGGGGGGGADGQGAGTTAAGAGGGGGGYFFKKYLASELNVSETYVVATGGVGGAAAAGDGANGTNTIFKSCSAIGGQGGTGHTGVGTNLMRVGKSGGPGVNGDINITGSTSGVMRMVAGVLYMSSAGGSSYKGFGGAGGTIAVGVSNPGQLYGGGAGGAISADVAANEAGANGANGVLIITEYIAA